MRAARSVIGPDGTGEQIRLEIEIARVLLACAPQAAVRVVPVHLYSVDLTDGIVNRASRKRPGAKTKTRNFAVR